MFFSVPFRIKLYVELTGTSQQASNVPADVHLKIRHLSSSYFKDGDSKIKQYSQPIGSYRKIKFNRLSTSDEQRCKLKTEQRSKSLLFPNISLFNNELFSFFSIFQYSKNSKIDNEKFENKM